ncbi:MAG: GNAT family N-acetyltransferase [Mesorhizobium sp.]|nr:GNAT family N-acetyltransferase [Mesorhizobium sp.]
MMPIRTERLILRNWQERDRELFHRINCDDRVMEFFPFRRDRAAADALMDEMRDDIGRSGFGFAAVEIAATGECAGFAGITEAEVEPHLARGAIEIGWRLAPEYWGKGYASEAAEAWLRHGFLTVGLDEIISYAVATNHRSTAVMRRIGMTEDPASAFEHPAIPDTHPGLKPFVLYRLGRDAWLKRNGAA